MARAKRPLGKANTNASMSSANSSSMKKGKKPAMTRSAGTSTIIPNPTEQNQDRHSGDSDPIPKNYDYLIEMEVERYRLRHELHKEWTSLGVCEMDYDGFLMRDGDRSIAPNDVKVRQRARAFLEAALEEQRNPPVGDQIVSRKIGKGVPGNERATTDEAGSSSQHFNESQKNDQARDKDNVVVATTSLNDDVRSKTSSKTREGGSSGRATRSQRIQTGNNPVIEPQNTAKSTASSNPKPVTKPVLTDHELKRCREKLKSILIADDRCFGKIESKYTPSLVKFELQVYYQGFEGYSHKLWDLIGVSKEEFEEFVGSAHRMSKDEGSQNEVCRRSWDLFRELEKERRDEAGSSANAEQSTLSNNSRTGTKRAAPAVEENESVPKKKKKRDALSEMVLRAISAIELEDEDYCEVEVYDTCDSLREKIREYLDQHDVAQTAFCRALSISLEDGKKVTPAQLKSFMAKTGAKAGNTSPVFYAGYCFMEKVRLWKKEKKSKFRLEMEDIWDGSQPITGGRSGFDIWSPDERFLVPLEVTSIEIDDYGVMHIFRDGL